MSQHPLFTAHFFIPPSIFIAIVLGILEGMAISSSWYPFMNLLILSSSTASCGMLQKMTIHFVNTHFQLPALSPSSVSFSIWTFPKWLKYLFALLMHFESCKSRDSILWLYTFFLPSFFCSYCSFLLLLTQEEAVICLPFSFLSLETSQHCSKTWYISLRKTSQCVE